MSVKLPDCPYPPGTHLVLPRRGWNHHGVVVDSGRVVEYANYRIRSVTYRYFTRGEPIVRVETDQTTLPVDVIVHRASFLVGERRYNPALNNCEHFARWCVEGSARSWQVEDAGLVMAAAGTVAGFFFPPAWFLAVSGLAVNAVQHIGGEPWNEPKYCRQCRRQHGWSEDAKIVPMPSRRATSVVVAG